MKEHFRSVNFREKSLAQIEQMNEIVEEYQQQGLRLTARQLYYQMVSRDLIQNLPAEYKKLTALLTDTRYAGLIDWSAIEDRGREPNTPSEWSNLEALADSALRAYRLPRWEGQKTYAELWVEKQALAGVLEPLASEFHVTLMVNKGYSSASAMKESADRIKRATIKDQARVDEIKEELAVGLKDLEKGDSEYEKVMSRYRPELHRLIRTPVIFYLGDHDPSGEDMVRDIDTRLKEFGVLWLEVKKVALTIAQVRQYNPPPNPAKITDPRADAYIAKFGEHSWEVDALPPNVLASLIRSSFSSVIDKKAMDSIKAREQKDKERLRAAVAQLAEET